MLDIIFYTWVVFLVFVSYQSRLKFGFWTNHYLLTNVYWLICLYISIYHNYYVHPISNHIYYVFFIGNIFFNLSLFTSKIKRVPYSFPSYTFSLKRRRFFELMVLCTLIPLAYSNLKLILGGGEMWRMYAEYWEAKENNNFLEEFFKQNIVTPISYVLTATCLYVNYDKLGKHTKLINILIAALLAVLNMLMTAGGRTALMQFMFFLFLSYFASRIVKSENVIYRIKTKYMAAVLSIGVIAFAFATLGRGGENVFDIIFERISLFPALFEAYYYDTDICDGYALGLSMFEQPISFLLFPFKLLGFDVSFERISTIVAQDIWTPATESYHNAAASAYTFYMRDFGIFGIALGPYIVGKIYNLLWKVCRSDGFLITFYFSGVCATCFDSTYPFARGYFFAILFAFLVRKMLKK